MANSSDLPRYRAAVVGCGLRGPHHAINFLVNRDRFDLVAIADRDSARLDKAYAALTSDPWNAPNLARFDDAEAMLQETRPDVFCFATRPHWRLDLLELGLQYGAKAICYEKPMALSLAEAWQIDRRLRETGTKATVAHIHKYGAYFRNARAAIADGKIGEIEQIHASCSGGYTGMATHMIDSMIFLMGGDVRVAEVSAFGQGGDRISDERSMASPGFVLANVLFDNGVRGILDCGEQVRKFSPGDLKTWLNTGITVRGTGGWIEVCLGNGWRAASRLDPNLTGSSDVIFDQIHDGDGYIADLARWLDDDDALHPCHNEITWHTFEAMMAGYLSIVEKAPVTLPLTEDQRNRDLMPDVSMALSPTP